MTQRTIAEPLVELEDAAINDLAKATADGFVGTANDTQRRTVCMKGSFQA